MNLIRLSNEEIIAPGGEYSTYTNGRGPTPSIRPTDVNERQESTYQKRKESEESVENAEVSERSQLLKKSPRESPGILKRNRRTSSEESIREQQTEMDHETTELLSLREMHRKEKQNMGPIVDQKKLAKRRVIPNLIKALSPVIGKNFLLTGAIKLIHDLITFLQPLILKYTLI